MVLNGANGNSETAGDLLTAQAEPRQPQHLDLPSGQGHGHIGC
jgi:hypothetical protein